RVRHCLVPHPQGRWKVADITARLQGGTPAPPLPGVSQPEKPRPAPPAALRANARVTSRTKPRSYAVPVAFALIVAAILGVSLFLRHLHGAQADVAALGQLAAPPAPPAQPLQSGVRPLD